MQYVFVIAVATGSPYLFALTHASGDDEASTPGKASSRRAHHYPVMSLGCDIGPMHSGPGHIFFNALVVSFTNAQQAHSKVATCAVGRRAKRGGLSAKGQSAGLGLPGWHGGFGMREARAQLDLGPVAES
jgi:hypothetical protein